MFDTPIAVTLGCAALVALAMTGRFLALILLPDSHWLVRWLETDGPGSGGGWSDTTSPQDGSDGGCGGDGGD